MTEHGQFRIQASDRDFGRKAGVMEVKLARYFLSSPKSKVLNVGAHVGTVAIPLSLHCSEVVAIEANPTTFLFLEYNVTQHDRNNIRALWMAASDKFEEIGFVMNRENTGGSKRSPAFRDNEFFYDNPKEISVPAAPLDDVVGKFGPFELVFMDCEGSEYHAMLGMPNILDKAETVIVEFFPRCLARVANITVAEFIKPLREFSYLVIPSQRAMVQGFEIHTILQMMHDKDQFDGGMVFCKRPERAKQLMGEPWLPFKI